MTQDSETVKLHCNRCIGDTNHEVIAKRRHHNEDEHSHFSEELTYEMLECRGCGNVTLRQTYDYSGLEEPEVTFYPPPVSRRKPQWGFHLIFRPDLNGLIGEVYTALYSGSLRLALMGARTAK